MQAPSLEGRPEQRQNPGIDPVNLGQCRLAFAKSLACLGLTMQNPESRLCDDR